MFIIEFQQKCYVQIQIFLEKNVILQTASKWKH